MSPLFKKATDEAVTPETEPTVEDGGSINPATGETTTAAPKSAKKAKAPKKPAEPKVKAEKPVKKPPTTADLKAAQQVWDDLKAEKAALGDAPVPVELVKKITKARRNTRAILKALGKFVPVADRPKKVKPVKEAKPKAEKKAPAAKGKKADKSAVPATPAE